MYRQLKERRTSRKFPKRDVPSLSMTFTPDLVLTFIAPNVNSTYDNFSVLTLEKKTVKTVHEKGKKKIMLIILKQLNDKKRRFYYGDHE